MKTVLIAGKSPDIGILEALKRTSVEGIQNVFATNTLGTIDMTNAFLTKFQQQNSSVTLTPLPLLSVYTANKAVINTFTESLAIALEQFNIPENLILPAHTSETRLAGRTTNDGVKTTVFNSGDASFRLLY